MIIEVTNIFKCWCPNCGHGQMEQILDVSFKEKKQVNEFVGNKIICKNCEVENIIEDVITFMPTNFIIQSKNTTPKENSDVKKFLEK